MTGFQSPAQFLWIAVPLAILLLYLFRPRYRPQIVPAAFFWQAAGERLSGHNFWRRLQHNRLLWLQLLFCALLILALMRPYQVRPGFVADQVVLLIDTSASMAAGKPTRLQQSLEQARQIIEQAPRQSQFLLATLDREVHILQALTGDRVALRRALGQIQVQAVRGRDELATPFFTSVQKNAPRVQLHWFSDHTLAGMRTVEHLATQGQTNYAIESFQVNTNTLFLALRNYSDETAQVTLRVRNESGFVLDRRYPVPARGRRLIQLARENAPGPFRAELLNGDDYPLDDQAWALEQSDRIRRVFVHQTVSEYLERGVQAVTGASLLRVDETGNRQEGLHLWQQLPADPGPGLHIAEAPPDSWVKQSVEDEGAVTLASTMAQQLGFRVSSQRWGKRLRLRERIDSEPYLVDLHNEALWASKGRSLVMLFPLDQSELPLSPELPILLGHWLEQNQDPWRKLGSLLCDNRVRLPGPAPIQLQGPRGLVKLPSVDWTPSWPGMYRLNEGGQRGGDISAVLLAVNAFLPEESNLKPAPTGTPTPSPASDFLGAPETRPMTREWGLPLAGLALLVLLLEFVWWRR